MENNKLKYLALGLLALAPVISFAALGGITNLLCAVLGILALLIKLVAALALVFFFWGGGQFILHAGDAKAREEGKQKMIWSIIALFVMFSIYGILGLISGTLEINLISPINNNASCGATFSQPNTSGNRA